jgi:hypothetical protein
MKTKVSLSESDPASRSLGQSISYGQRADRFVRPLSGIALTWQIACRNLGGV